MIGAATVVLDPRFTVGPVDRRLFGSFVEHMGRSVYGGIYEPDHPGAGEDGFRDDVRELVRELGPTVLRYPGGNFVSTYRWEDGVGPVEGRPVRLDLAWRSLERNLVGVDEFVPWARGVGAEPMMAVNLGTRGVQEAVDLIEYTNHPGGTRLSDLRAANGHREPHAIRMWCLGNEQDAVWQVGQKTAHEYGRLAAEAGKAMRLVDPTIELVAVGSSGSQMPTFASWEATVLEHTYDVVDHISLHAYYEEVDGDLATFLATAVDMDRFIEAVVATADHVRAKVRSPKRLMLSFDEWNVWYLRRFTGPQGLDWQEDRPLIEDDYTLADAVAVGSYLVSLLNHADRVAIACQAQLVNVIAPIRTEPGGRSWRQSTFHPFAHTARLARGTALRAAVDSPTYPTEAYGQVPYLHAAATHEPASGDVVVLLVNRGVAERLPVEVDVRAFGGLEVLEHLELAGADPYLTNDADHPDRVTVRAGRGARLVDGLVRLVLPPLSWTAVRLGPEAG